MNEQHAMPSTKEIETLPEHGPIRKVTIRKFAAFEGWQARAAAIDYMKSEDAAFRSQFTLNVLATATVEGKALDNVATVDELLHSWPNIEAIFNEVLKFNQIDLAQREYAEKAWDGAGARLALAMTAHLDSMFSAMKLEGAAAAE